MQTRKASLLSKYSQNNRNQREMCNLIFTWKYLSKDAKEIEINVQYPVNLCNWVVIATLVTHRHLMHISSLRQEVFSLQTKRHRCNVDVNGHGHFQYKRHDQKSGFIFFQKRILFWKFLRLDNDIQYKRIQGYCCKGHTIEKGKLLYPSEANTSERNQNIR